MSIPEVWSTNVVVSGEDRLMCLPVDSEWGGAGVRSVPPNGSSGAAAEVGAVGVGRECPSPDDSDGLISNVVSMTI